MLKKILITVIALSFLLPTYVSAATYFVAPNGNDSNSGTQQQPFKTIQKGVNKLSPGDTLNIRGGTYVEQVNITKGGTAQNPVTIQAYQNEQVTIDGEYKIPSGTVVSFITNGINRGYVRQNNNGTYTFLEYSSTQANPTIYPATYNVLVKVDAKNIVIDGIDIVRSRGRGLVTSQESQNIIIRNCEIKHLRLQGWTDYGTENTMDNCKLTDITNYAPFSRAAGKLNWAAAIALVHGENGTLKNTSISNTWGEGVISGTGSLIEYNTIYNTFSTLLYAERSDNATFRGNLIYNTHNEYLRNGGVSECINATNETTGSPGSGNNINLLVENNIAIGCNNGFNIYKSDPAPENFIVRNNTFVNQYDADATNELAIFLGGVKAEGSGTIYNNLVYQSRQAGFVSDTNNTRITFKSNLWYATNNSTITQSARSSSDVTSDPLLVNPNVTLVKGGVNPSNYGPKANSPAIGKATGTTPQRDFFGCVRDNKPDIGAVEYGGTDCNRDIVPTINTPTPSTQDPTPTPSITPLNKYDVTENGVVDILDIIDVIKYVFGG